LCFGHSSGDWAKAYAAMNAIYTTRQPVWRQVNQVAQQELLWSAIPDDMAAFVGAVMGGILDDQRGRR
jgi:hypothetical protein